MESPRRITKTEEPAILKKIEKWGRIAGLVSLSFIGAVLANEKYHDAKYDSHLEEIFDEKDRERIELLKKKLTQEIGGELVAQIEQKDEVAFEEVENAQTPEFVGVEALPIDSEVVKRVLSEEYFPKGWINAQVKEINFTDPVGTEAPKGLDVAGEFQHSLRSVKGVMRFSGLLKAYQEIKEKIPPRIVIGYMKDIFAHESGHANDWLSDKESNLLERYELLEAVLERMKNTDRLSNSKDPSEYWANICRVYFEYPAIMQLEFSKDFKLVDEFVKKVDPNYNVLQKNLEASQLMDQHFGKLASSK